MGDTQAPRQEQKRNVIVTSTPSIKQEPIEEHTPKSPNSEFASPEASTILAISEASTAAMYGPTLAAHPHQWQYYPQQPAYMSHTLQNRYSQPSFPSSQQMYNANSMNFQGSMGLPQQAVPYYETQSQQGMPGLVPFQQYPTAPGPSPVMYQVSQPQNVPLPATTSQYNQNFGQMVYDHQSQSYPPQMSAPAFPTYSMGYPNQIPTQGMMQHHVQSHWPQPSYPVPYQSSGYNVDQQSMSTYNMGLKSQSFRRESRSSSSNRIQNYMTTDSDMNGHYRRQPGHSHFRPRRMSPTSSNTGQSSVTSSNGIGSTVLSTINGEDKLQVATNPSLPRGPPRKPRQSGHALWVGNLPPGVNVLALKDYFATTDIESVFLISKSNCAFVNYRTEEACNQAMIRFHDSRFQGIRLVCRLRRSTSPVGEVNQTLTEEDVIPTQNINENAQSSEDAVADAPPTDCEVDRAVSSLNLRDNKERFFILKSLTVEDLDLSARNGVWATQSHNEPTLNAAYKSCENVYLIFSANKSGEYYGYAKMKSEISDDISSKIEWAPLVHINDDPNLPKAIYTASTETAPRGRIIDDSSRGTIFWEAIDENNQDDDDLSGAEDVGEERTTISKSWGKPFRVEWISTSKIPFYRTRGLRNSYNVSREVKIARDGTELEPLVGSKLLQMFQRSGVSSLVSSYEGTQIGSVAMLSTPSDLSHSTHSSPVSDAVEPQTHDESGSDTVTEETTSSSL